MTQKELSVQIDFNRTSITNIENGRQHITLDTLFHLAATLEIPPAKLLPHSNPFLPSNPSRTKRH